MRPINKEEAEKLRPLLADFDEKRDAMQDAELAVGRYVHGLRRACTMPSDAVIDDCSLEWCRQEQTPNGPKRVPLKIES